MRTRPRTPTLLCHLALAGALCAAGVVPARAALLEVTLIPNASGTGVTIEQGFGTFLIDDDLIRPNARVSFADIVVDLEIGGVRFDRSLAPVDEAVIFGSEGREIVELVDAGGGSLINLSSAEFLPLLVQEGPIFRTGSLVDAFGFNLTLPIASGGLPLTQFTGRLQIATVPAAVPLPPSILCLATALAALAAWNALRRGSPGRRFDSGARVGTAEPRDAAGALVRRA